MMSRLQGTAKPNLSDAAAAAATSSGFTATSVDTAATEAPPLISCTHVRIVIV